MHVTPTVALLELMPVTSPHNRGWLGMGRQPSPEEKNRDKKF